MVENNNKIKRIFTPKRKTVRILGIVLAILFFLQIGLYFASDFLLRSYLKDKVRVISDDKYDIDFDRFYISLFQRGIAFEGFTLIPNVNNFPAEVDNPYYKISVPEISIKRLNYLFRIKEFQIGDLSLRNPAIEFKLDTTETKNSQQSALQILQQEIRKSFLKSSLNEIRIKNLHVEEADFLIQNFISQRAIKARNTDLWLKDIQLLQMRSPETPFNAEGFSIDLEGFEVLLADSVHLVQASNVHVSSLEQIIKANNINIIPDFEKPSRTYFQVSLDDLELSDADINKVFYTSEVEVGQLKIMKPDFQLYSSESKAKADQDVFDLYGLIEGLISSISITDFSIDEGKFIQRDMLDHSKYRIKSERIDFAMRKVYIGPDESKKQNQFFYAQDAIVDVFKVDLALADSVHWIYGEEVHLSSFDDAINIKGLNLRHEIVEDPEKNRTLFEIQVPELNINEANLKKIYNQKIMDIQEIVIRQPEILLKDVQGKTDVTTSFDLKTITQDFLEAIYVGRLEMQEGSVTVDNNLRVRQDSLSFGKLSFVLENFSLDESTGDSDARSNFLAEDLQLELDDYALKLADDLHVFTAAKLFLDTKRKLIRIDGFSIKPQNPGQIQAYMDRYGKTTAMDIYVPHFSATGVDIPEAYFKGILKVDQILVPSPNIGLTRYRSNEDEDEGESVDQRDILDLVTNYFSEVSVDSLILQKGSLNYENYVGERIRTFTEDNVSIAVKNFRIHEGTNPEEFKSLFSEEVDLSLNNYVFSLADGKYNIVADRINFNSAREEIVTSNVRLNPTGSFNEKTRISALIPSLSFTGVDLEAFLFDNTLNLDKVKFSGSSVNLLINNDFEEDNQVTSNSGRRDRLLPKTIDIIEIDTVEAENAKFNLTFRESGEYRELINTGVNLTFFDLSLDSAKLEKADISSFFSGMSMEIDEFWLTLEDSIHQLTFSKIALDTRYEGILLNNLRVIPKNLSGNPGSPIFSAHIPSVLIKTNSLEDLQVDKNLLIREVQLFRPDIEIFLDEEDLPQKESEEKAVVDLLLETLSIGKFEVIEGDIAILDKNSSKEPQNFRNLNASFNDLKFDLTDVGSINRESFLNKNFIMSLPDYEILMKDSLNKVNIGMITLTNKDLKITDLTFSPLYGKYEYARKVGVQTDALKAVVPEIFVKNINLERLIENNEFLAESFTIKDADINLFRDKRFPISEKRYRPMPQVLMKDAGMVVHLDTLRLINGQIDYSEFPVEGMIPGNIFFRRMNVEVHPFSLEKEENEFPIEKSYVSANMYLNGEAELDIDGSMSFEEPYPITLAAETGEFELDILNTIMEANAFATVRSGKVNGAKWSFTADDKAATGEMTMLYEDLNIMLLNERTLQKATGRKGILTFVINAFAVRSNNPRKLFNITVGSSIYETRDENRFIFNYLWRATLSGIKGSLGLGQPKPIKEHEAVR